MVKFFAALTAFCGGVAFIVALALLVAWPLAAIWNGCVVGTFNGVHEVSTLQMWGLMVMGRLFLAQNISITQK